MRTPILKLPSRVFVRGMKAESRVHCACGLCRLRVGRKFISVHGSWLLGSKACRVLSLEFDENHSTEDAPLPFYLRPLVWLNAPMDALPEAAREAIGKVALLTLFNAVAVMIYVLVFRRRHG